MLARDNGHHKINKNDVEAIVNSWGQPKRPPDFRPVADGHFESLI